MSQKLHSLGTGLFVLFLFVIMLSNEWAKSYRSAGYSGPIAEIAPGGNLAFVITIQLSFLASLGTLVTAEICRYREARSSGGAYRFLGE